MVIKTCFGNSNEIFYDGDLKTCDSDIQEIKSLKQNIEKFPFQEIFLLMPKTINKNILSKLLVEIKPKERSVSKTGILFKL